MKSTVITFLECGCQKVKDSQKENKSRISEFICWSDTTTSKYGKAFSIKTISFSALLKSQFKVINRNLVSLRNFTQSHFSR